MLTQQELLRIAYLTICSDGKMTIDEIEKFEGIAKEVFSVTKTEIKDIKKGCDEILGEAEDETEVIDIIIEEISKSLESLHKKAKPNLGYIRFFGTNIQLGKYETTEESLNYFLFLIISLSMADGEYSTEEKRIIRLIARKIEIDKSLVKEMEDTVTTLYQIEKQRDYLNSRISSETENIALYEENKRCQESILESIPALISIY